MVTSAPANVPNAPDDLIRAAVQSALTRHHDIQGNLLPILHTVQDTLGHIPSSCVPMLADALRLSRAEIHGVITFYAYYRQTPAAPIKLEICRAESCQAMGADALAAHAVQTLGCHFKSTSRDDDVDLEPVYCLGLCAQSPAVAVNGKPYARMSPQKLDKLLITERARHSAKAQS